MVSFFFYIFHNLYVSHSSEIAKRMALVLLAEKEEVLLTEMLLDTDLRTKLGMTLNFINKAMALELNG